MDSDFINKGMETVSNLSKLAANVTAKTTANKEEKKEDMNQPHNQTVEVKVGDPAENRKPVILKEKNETHIHKVFPDNRELNQMECEIEKIRLMNEHELKMRELQFRIDQENALRAERKEREEYARKERERRQEKDQKFFRRVGFVAAGVAIAGLGYTAYSLYTGPRDSKGNGIHIHKESHLKITDGEGTVE